MPLFYSGAFLGFILYFVIAPWIMRRLYAKIIANEIDLFYTWLDAKIHLEATGSPKLNGDFVAFAHLARRVARYATVSEMKIFLDLSAHRREYMVHSGEPEIFDVYKKAVVDDFSSKTARYHNDPDVVFQEVMSEAFLRFMRIWRDLNKLHRASRFFVTMYFSWGREAVDYRADGFSVMALPAVLYHAMRINTNPNRYSWSTTILTEPQ